MLLGKRRVIKNVLITYGFLSAALLGVLVATNDMLRDCFQEISLSYGAILGIVLWGLLVATALKLQNHFFSFRGQRVVMPVLATVLLVGFWWKLYGLEELTGGLKCLSAIYLRAVNVYYMTGFSLPFGTAEHTMPALAFSYMLLLTVMVSVCVYLRKYHLLLGMPFLVLAAEMLVGLTPGRRAMGCFFLVMVLLNCGTAVSYGWGLKLLTLGLTLVILLFAGRVSERKGQDILKNTDRFVQFQMDVETFLKEVPIGQGLLGAPHLDNDRPEFEDKIMLTVTCDSAVEGKLYLREAFADNYWKGYWTVNQRPLEKEAKAADVDLNELWEEMADLLYQRTLQTGQPTAAYSVDCEQFGSSRMYLTYGAHWEDGGEFSLDEQGMAKKNRLFAARSFQAPRSNDFDGSFGYVMYGFSGDGTFPGSDSSALSWYGSYLRDHVEVLSDQPTAKQIASQIPMEISYASENRRRYAYAQAVANYLKKQYTYSLDLEELPSGADAIEYFLSEGRKGYCMHFASAGVAILRHLGVPSRYASGYVIPKSGFVETEDGYTAEVLDSQGHAWVEIFLDGLGWVPVEMTPGYGDSLPEDRPEENAADEETEQPTVEPPSNEASAESSEESEEANTNASQPEETSESGFQVQVSEEKDTPLWEIWFRGSEKQTGSVEIIVEENSGTSTGNSGENSLMGGEKPTFRDMLGAFFRKVGAVLLVLLKCAVVLAGIVVLFWGSRQLVRTIRRRRFLRRENKLKRYMRRGKYSAAAVTANRFLYGQLHSFKRMTKQPETDQMFLEELKERFVDISREDWDKYYEIIIRAFYGKDEITRAEAEYACRMYREQSTDKVN